MIHNVSYCFCLYNVLSHSHTHYRLHTSEYNQHRHTLCSSRHNTSDQEDSYTEQEDRLSTKDVCKFTIQRLETCVCKHI